MSPTGLEAGIVTTDIDGLSHFYARAFGFSVVSDVHFPQGHVRRLRCGDAAIKLFSPADGSRSRTGDDAWYTRDGFAYAALHVEDADDVVTRAVACGASVITPVTAHRPGARYALVADPAGNVWEILEDRGPTT